MADDIGVLNRVTANHSRPLDGRVALVSGGSGEIGRVVALALAARGAHVVVGYARREERALEVAESARGLGVDALAARVDVTSQALVNEFVRTARNHFGRIDILVSGAAAGRMLPVLEMDLRGWSYTLSVNAAALMLLCQAAVPLMRQGGWGRIVALSSMGVQRVVPRYGALGASKAALETLVRYLAHDLAPHGITANTVTAPYVDTDALDRIGDREAALAGMRARTPAKRNVRPADIAGVVGLLCSDDAAMVQGQTIVVDGGWGLVV
jgi:enoyl-[acyl-carrier protein] reductase III